MQFKFRTEKNQRLDQAVWECLSKQTPDLSKAKLKKIFTENRVLLDGRAAKPSLNVGPGTIEFEIKDWDANALAAAEARASETCFLPIVYEDAEILVFNKKDGVASLPLDGKDSKTAVGAALAHDPKIREIGEHPLECGLIHRLDPGTSGLLVFAKTEKSFGRLKKLWKEKKVTKIYRALTDRSPPPLKMPFSIDTALAHLQKSDKRMHWIPRGEKPSQSIRGKILPAETTFLSIERAPDTHSLKLWDATLQLHTGVRHQIRCHLASLGIPILGDALYGGTPAHRVFLHAWRLEIPRIDGDMLSIEAPLPEMWGLD